MLNSTTSLAEIEVRNAINLNGGTRIIQVDDNTNTATDFATISGVISNSTGTGNLNKSGSGILQLLGANTYNGTTAVTGGVLAVTSLGHSSLSGVATSVGISTGANTSTQAVTMGNAGTTGGILQYVGTGETSDRMIRLNTTTGTAQIHADGSGPLMLTNVVNDMIAGAKILALRGSNTGGNTISSNLANHIGGTALAVTVDGSATWILSGNNTFTGTMTVGGGAFGVGSATATGNGNLVLSNASMFAHGGDRTVTNATVTQNTNTGFAFIGENSLAFTGTFAQALTSTNNSSFTNNIIAGETLTFGNMTFNSLSQARAFTINGSGDTIISGSITTNKAFDVTLTYSGTGSLTLGGTGSDWSGGTGGNLSVTSGSLVLGASEVIPDGAGNGGLIINPAAATTAAFDLNGNSETVNAFTFNGAGIHTIDNTSTSAATLTMGAANAAVTIGGGGGSYTITDSDVGALSLSKVGSGVGTISTGVTLTYQGATSASGGGSLTINSPLNGTTSLSATGMSSSLTLAGGLSNANAITSVTAGDGALLSFIDGAGNKLTNLSSLTLGSPASVNNTWISFNVGDLATAGDALNTDSLVLVSGGILDFGDSASPIFLNITDTGLNPNTSYVLMDATAVGGGFLNGTTRTLSYYDLGDTPGGFTSMSLSNSTTNQIILTTGSLITGELFWRGLTDTTWNGSLDNWSTDRAGTIVASSTPGQGSDVIFQYDSASNAAVLTGLEQNFKVNSVSFEPHSTNPANTPVSVTIGAGSVATNRLEVAPQSNVDGLAIPTGGPASVTISAPFRVGTSQTWTVADAATTLTLSGGLQGSADVIKAGSGKVSITAAAEATFNTGLTSDITIGAGTLELTHAGALGTSLLNNTANILLNGGAFYYNNAASGTVNNPITMNGGTLSAGGAGQTYSGAINVSALSNINLRDGNSAVTSATARNITLSGIIGGTAGISLDSNDTTATGNQVGGNLTLSNNANTWSGQLGLTRGTAIITSTAGFGGNIQFNQYGRVILRNTDGNSLDRSGALSYAAGAVGEFQIDNTGALASNYTVNQNGAVNLNAGSIVRLYLADVASELNLAGGVVLNGNASLSVAGGDADSLVTISDVGISGTGNLAINDESGTWNTTSSRLAINVASTFTGNTSLNEGTLILGHKDALSTGTLAITGASTLQASTDLSGANAIPNALTLSNNLTVAGSNNLTIGGATTQSTASRTITNNLTGGSTFRLASLHLAEAITARTLTITGAGITTIGTLVNDGANNNITNNSTGGVTIDTRVNLSEVVGTGRSLTFGGTGTTNVTGTIANWSGAGGAAGNITKSNAGTLILSAANTYTGTTGITNGTVRYGINNAIPTTSAVTVNPAAAGVTATLDLNGYSGTIASLALGGSGQTSTSAAIVQTGVGTLTLGGGVTTSATGNPTTTPLITGNLSLGTATRTFTVANSAGSLVDLDVQAVISGTGGLIKDGSGVLQLSGENTFSGTVTLSPSSSQSRGVIAATADNALGTGAVSTIFASGAVTGQIALTGGITLGNTTWTTSGPGSEGTVNGLIRNISGTNTITGAMNLTGGGGGTTLRSDSGTLVWSGNVGSVFNGARDLTLVGAGDFLFSGTLRDSNQSSASDVLNLVINNTGTTTFSGANTYTGTLNVAAGSTLVAGSTQAFGVDSISTLLGTVRLNGFNNSLGSIEGVGIIENGAATDATFTLQGVHNTSFFGTIQDGAGGGSLSLVRAGTGTTILETENTYTGLTTVNGGLLIVQHSSGLGATSAGTIVNSGGTLRLNTVDIGSEPVTINGTGFASGGAIDVINTSVINTTLNVATDSTIQVLTVLDTLMLNGGITGNGQITKKGAGFLVIPVGSPGYGGDILVESGILRASNVNAFGNSSGITTVASGATVQLEGGVNIANESLVVYGISSSNRGALGSSSGTNTWSSNISFAGLYSGMFASPGSVLIVGASVANSVNKTDTALTLYGGGNIIINSVINGDGDGDEFNDDLIISGATVQLNAQNTYTGPTYIENGGTLRNGITNALPSSSTVGSTGSTILTLGNATDGTVTNTYDLNGYNQTVATLGSVQSGTNTNIITNAGSADSTLSVSSGSYAGTIQDGGTHSVALTKQGAASDTLTLSNPTGNTYSGPTNVSTGTLNVTNTSGSATGTGDITVADGATLAGTGRIAPASGNSIYLNGDIIIGDSTLGTPIASSLTLATSGAGSTLLGATSSIGFDLFQRGGDLSGTASASDFINLVGILDATAGGTFVLLNPTGLSGFTTGDAWKLFSLTSGSITGTPIIDDSALGLTGGLYGQFNSVTGIYSILGGVPEPSRTLLSLFGLLACFMRRRRSAR
ncbi:MAG: autotransporter-associated beta strand repeat-containing protein [Verrucomicrobiaceae bacterium]|nr:autotransporter-associated beta strand repeat-containing protein [Verrucomicrobiaceae bacterium]